MRDMYPEYLSGAEVLYDKSRQGAFTLSQFATATGLRQQTQIEHLSTPKALMAYWMLDTMSESTFERQLKSGAEFVCGYRPGMIPDESMFDAIASKTRLSEKHKNMAKDVLVNGHTVAKVSKDNSSFKQMIDQSCVTICRLAATIDTARTESARNAIDNLKKHSQAIRPSLLLGLIVHDSEKNILSHIRADSIPGFGQAAIYSIVSNLNQSQVESIEYSFLSRMEKIESFRFDTGASYLSLHLILEGLDKADVPSYLQSKSEQLKRVPPSLESLEKVSNAAIASRKLSPKALREQSMSDGRTRGVYHLSKIDKLIKKGLTISEAAARYYPDVDFSRVYRAYRKWQEGRPAPYWI